MDYGTPKTENFTEVLLNFWAYPLCPFYEICTVSGPFQVASAVKIWIYSLTGSYAHAVM